MFCKAGLNIYGHIYVNTIKLERFIHTPNFESN